ncbi:MAG: DUF4350 domain-containing protein [Sulfolobales archaeon]|nr:DUF4350 domain-containing protein [Sulfolobales archaeon]
MRSRALIVSVIAVLAAASFVIEREVGLRVPSGASPLNSGPDGTSDLAQALVELGFEVSVVTSWLSVPRSPSPCLIVIVSPETPYSDPELAIIRELTLRGTNVLIADEGPYSNGVLSYLGIPVRVSPSALLPPIFTATARIDGRELSVVFAHSSTLDLGDVPDPNVSVLSSANGSALAALYRAGSFSVVVVSDGTIFTNSLINPRNALNPNYLFTYYVVKNLCPGGAVLIEGSKYELKPPPLSDSGTPLIALLNPLGRALALALLVLVLAYSTTPRKVSKKVEELRREVGYYEVARHLCGNRELLKYIADECHLFMKTRRARQLLDAVAAAVRRDRRIAIAVLESVVSDFRELEKRS